MNVIRPKFIVLDGDCSIEPKSLKNENVLSME